MNIGERLAYQRKNHNLTQAELSEKLSMSQQVISNYERNITSPPIEFLQLLADLYSISLDELIGRQGIEYSDGLDKQILDIIVTLDKKGKELSLVFMNALAQYKEKKDDK
ncbi:helix-turn-helix domain-containing protein [Enterocloster bolteae]|uniref:helix-turn-helix domain-containing protein n=1 Tax=Enterocloster bolteae TaxID=208479 RepID=UPI003AF1A21F